MSPKRHSKRNDTLKLNDETACIQLYHFKCSVKYKDEVMNSLKERGYVFENKIQEEFSIYDSNSSVDSGWLITS